MNLLLLLAQLLLASLSPEAVSTMDCGDTSDNGTVIVKGGETESADYVISKDIIP